MVTEPSGNSDVGDAVGGDREVDDQLAVVQLVFFHVNGRFVAEIRRALGGVFDEDVVRAGFGGR